MDSMYKTSALVIASLSSFLIPFMTSSINVALPIIGEDFSSSAITLNWIATIYITSLAVFLLPMGRLADIYGRKNIFLNGIIIYTASSLLCGLSNSSLTLIVLRVIQGGGSAMIFSTGTALLTSVFPVNERGKVIGINVASVYLGLSLGPSIGGFLIYLFGWRSIFLINLPFGFALIWLLMWKLKGEWAESKGESFDIAGSIFYGIAIVMMIYGVSLLPKQKGFLLILAGLIFVVFFIYWENKIDNPIVRISLFRKSRSFLFSNLAAMINYSATYSVSFLLSLYLQYIKGMSPKDAGIILVAQPVVMAMFSPIAGRVSDKIEPGLVASIGMSFTTVGLFLLIFLTRETSTTMIVLNLIILGLGFALFSSPNTNAILSSVEKKYYGVASALVGTMRSLGQVMSMAISMVVISIFLGNNKITEQYHDVFMTAMRYGFIISSAICFGGIFISSTRGNIRK